MGLFFVLTYGALNKLAPLSVKKSLFFRQPGSFYTKYRGEVQLPVQGYWQIVDSGGAAKKNITELYLQPTTPLHNDRQGGRLKAITEKKQITKGRHFLQRLYWPCAEYAGKHGNTGPSSIQDIIEEKRYKYLQKNLARSPYDSPAGQDIKGPFIFLVPRANFRFQEKDRFVRAKDKETLAFELRPYVDDGKHWVLDTGGSCQRLPVDKKLLKKYKQTIHPVIPKKKEMPVIEPDKHSYTLTAVCKAKPGKPLLLTVENAYSGDTMEIKWDMRRAVQAKEGEHIDIDKQRFATWLPYAGLSQSPLLTTWLTALKEGDDDDFFFSWERWDRRGKSLSVFDILGGRAAVRETLQMQVLAGGANAAGERPADYVIDVESIAGVQVESHPFREMLKKSSGKSGTLPLADVTPQNRFFVYIANPRDILAFLDQGCGFLHRMGTAFTGNGVDYELDKKYPARLGFDRKLLRTLLEAGIIKECALIFPDLFFIDGTDVTVAARLSKPGAIKSLLQLLGKKELAEKRITAFRSKNGANVYWSFWDDLLLIGTNKNEVAKILQLKNSGGKGSLGLSDEFRYMLSKLPLKKSTWGYVYFSDPFIRRLVGPAVKIGQLRRIRARAYMEYLTSRSLLAQLDGRGSPFSIESLIDYGYISRRAAARPAPTVKGEAAVSARDGSPGGEYYFDKDHILHSKTYGTLAHMKPISQAPVQRVSEKEKKAYKGYVDQYSSYWREYFDPIALRLDEAEDGFLEAEIFILPLVDNTIYNSLKGALKSKTDNEPLNIPRLSRDPVLMLSLNLGEEAWRGIVKDGYSLLSRYLPIHPAIFEDFGPGLHLTVHDADPVIALGSGDLLGIFDANFGGSSASGMLSLPVLLSVLTRPCTLIIETRDPGRTLSFLKRSVPALRQRDRWRELQVRVHQVENRDQWVFSFGIAGIIKLRFGVELQDRFLLIRNIPWSHREKITAVDQGSLQGFSLRAYPDACELQLPGLFEAHQDGKLFEAFEGAGHLFPIVLSGSASIEGAAAKHAQLFGFTPRHPGEGHFVWENFHIGSSVYGTVFKQRQPAYREGDREFGLLAGFTFLGVSMQFEDSGLRTRFRWKFKR